MPNVFFLCSGCVLQIIYLAFHAEMVGFSFCLVYHPTLQLTDSSFLFAEDMLRMLKDMVR